MQHNIILKLLLTFSSLYYATFTITKSFGNYKLLVKMAFNVYKNFSKFLIYSSRVEKKLENESQLRLGGTLRNL